ncbi:hypothetical protein GGR56DRAFT_520370 [Xylariaceae sp. FL0804]|nr:hypothetical protein GGR56DRAFT_520370 [Xylariaceae sp. FL0804]
MEALAAIGLASNIIQFIEVGHSLLKTAKEYHRSSKDAIRCNEDLASLAEDMKRVSARLSSNTPQSELADNAKPLAGLAAECQRHSNDLLALLDQLKNRKPGSKLHALSAAVRNRRKNDEKMQLEKSLDNIWKQIDTEISVLARSETVQKLKELVASKDVMKDEILKMSQNIDSLGRSLAARGGNESSLAALQSLGQIPHRAIALGRLQAEGADAMNERYINVDDSHAKTFEWLLENSQVAGPNSATMTSDELESRLRSLLDSQSQQTDSFRQEASECFCRWLRHGRGIFHISGKPGAGKSTLMKFLCKSSTTTQLLQGWAGQKKLVFAKAFFWRQGRSSQKSLRGLAGTLLFQILRASPDLMPSSHSAYDDDYSSLLSRLLSNRSTFKDRKFVFFIDGLDEYDGRHIDLVKKFVTWADDCKDDLKICVASREWNEFMLGFAECPRLRVHQCTHMDIARFVSEKLEEQDRQLSLLDEPTIRRLEHDIVEKAEGVFLWVRLALNAVEDGLLNGDSPSDLLARVASFPSELNDLYQHLLDSISEPDRLKAYVALRVCDFFPLPSPLPLLQFWFLNDAMADPTFAFRMSPGSQPGERDRYLKLAHRQVYGRCKGFLEVVSSPVWDQPGDGLVMWMHSTAQEFVSKSPVKTIMDDTVGHVDIFERRYQTFLALVKFGAPEPFYNQPAYNAPLRQGTFDGQMGPIMEYASLHYNPSNFDPGSQEILCEKLNRFLIFLDELEVCAGAQKLFEQSYLPAATTGSRGVGIKAPAEMLQIYALEHYLHEFLRRKDHQRLNHQRLMSITLNESAAHEHLDLNLIRLLLFGLTPRYGYQQEHSTMFAAHQRYERLYETVKWCISFGVSPNQVSQMWDGLSMFECFLCFFLFKSSSFDDPPHRYDISVRPYRLFEMFLRHGARSRLEFRFWSSAEAPEPLRQNSSEPPMENTGFILSKILPSGRPKAKPEDIRQVLVTNNTPGSVATIVSAAWTKPVVALASQHDWTISLRQLLKLWFPDDYHGLHRLIDKNEDAAGLRGASQEPTDIAPEYIPPDGRSWSDVEIGKSPCIKSISRNPVFRVRVFRV